MLACCLTNVDHHLSQPGFLVAAFSGVLYEELKCVYAYTLGAVQYIVNLHFELFKFLPTLFYINFLVDY